MILLAILAPGSFAMSINYEDPETEAGLRSHRYEEGGGADRHSGHENKHGDSADESYKDYQDVEEIRRDDHDLNKDYEGYAVNEAGGEHRNYDDDYYDGHRVDEKDEDGESFHEDGHHGKGHSTNGHHETKKLDEFVKRKEFHDSDYESDFDEQEDGKEDDFAHGNDGHHKGEEYIHDDHDGDYGKKNYYKKGHDISDYMEYGNENDPEDYYYNDYRYGKSDEYDDKKKWGYKMDR
ncbi:protein PFC0760c-like [Colletes gigas]|uniref:protein PFC0760c-like n=1 Tax=Colletes gigas TaxID=935657 RepID=UPI001C9B6419|nr:protein PFC0760c-like [Colletes gigas]